MTGALSSVERVRILFGGGIPDKRFIHLHKFLIIAHQSGMPCPDYLQNGVAMALGRIEAWQEFGHVVLLLENGTTALADDCGCQVEYPSDSAPVFIRSVRENWSYQTYISPGNSVRLWLASGIHRISCSMEQSPACSRSDLPTLSIF